MMYVCNHCGAMFEEPETERICLEDYYGVGGAFGNSNYGYIDVCPECGSDNFDEVYEDDTEYIDDEEGE